MDISYLILDSGSDTYQSSASLHLHSIQSQNAGFGMKPSIHCEELPSLNVSGFYFLLWTAYYPGREPDHRQGAEIDFVLPI